MTFWGFIPNPNLFKFLVCQSSSNKPSLCFSMCTSEDLIVQETDETQKRFCLQNHTCANGLSFDSSQNLMCKDSCFSFLPCNHPSLSIHTVELQIFIIGYWCLLLLYLISTTLVGFLLAAPYYSVTEISYRGFWDFCCSFLHFYTHVFKWIA